VPRREYPLSSTELRTALSGVFLIAVGLRLFLILTQDRTVWGDEPAYLILARSFLSGQGYSHYSGLADVYLPPGYPLLVGLANWFVRDWMVASDVWFLVGGAAALLPLFLLGRALYDARTALIAGLIYALSPALAAGTLFGGSLTEPPYLFFLLGGLYFGYQMFERDRWQDSLLAGICFSAAYLIRLEGRLYFFVFLAYRLLRFLWSSETNWRRAFGRLALYALGFGVLAMPYLVYLHSATGEWVLAKRSSQAYVAAKALMRDDLLLYDLEMWGLDPKGQEVRYYSSDGVEIPLLTLFFDDPVEFTKDVFLNAQRTFDLFMQPGFFGSYLMVFVALGLVSVSWDWRRVAGEGFLLLGLLPLAGFWLFNVTPRDVFPALPILALWAGRGLVYFGRWVDRTGKNLRQVRARPTAERWVKALVLLAIAVFLLVMNYRVCRNPYAAHIYELKGVARWIEQNTPPHAVIMTRQPGIAFHAERKWVVLPHAPFPECLQYARSHGVDYWVFESDVIRARRPQLIPLLEGRQVPEELEEIKRIEIPPQKTYAIFAMQPSADQL